MKFVLIILSIILITYLLICIWYWIYSYIYFKKFNKDMQYFVTGCTVCPLRIYCDLSDVKKDIKLSVIDRHPEINFNYKVVISQEELNSYYQIEVSYKGRTRKIDEKFDNVDKCQKIITSLVKKHVVYMNMQVNANEKRLNMQINADRLNKKIEQLNN